jgi:hypothetical protein
LTAHVGWDQSRRKNLRQRILPAALNPHEIHSNGELLASQLAIGVNISKIPDLGKDFLRELSLHEECNGLVTCNNTHFRCVDGLEYGVKMRLLLGSNQPISSSLG